MTATRFPIRPAGPGDCEIIAEFNCRLAAETEGKRLNPETVLAGVEAVLTDDRKGRYFVACHDGRIIGQLMHTFEWSDWRNGDIWWLQSVYVHPDFRRQGVFRALATHLQTLADEDPGVVGLRLYVENDNARALQTYESLSFVDAAYRVMEHLL